MTITVNLIDDILPVEVDDRTADLGGAFYYNPLRPYSPSPLKWAWEQISRYPNATLIDVGASTGCYSLLARHHPDLSVWAFEPVQLTYEVLKENIRLNSLTGKVHIFRQGVSDYDGVGVLHSVKAIGGSGVSMVDGTPALQKDCNTEAVRVIYLDAFCEKYQIIPTLLKIDVEGGEKFVLQGARETIAKYHPFLIVEYAKENTDQYGYGVNELIKIVEDMGYVWTNPDGTDLLCTHLEWEKITASQVIEGDKIE